MACSGLGIVLDTNVFVSWCNHEYGFGNIMEIVVDDGFYIVLCRSLRAEYLRQLERRYVGAGYQVLKSKLDVLWSQGILRYTQPADLQNAPVHRKDLHVLLCALNDEHEAHLIITDDDDDFNEIADIYLLPVVLTSRKFVNPNTRENSCSEASRVMEKVKQFGSKAKLVKSLIR